MVALWLDSAAFEEFDLCKPFRFPKVEDPLPIFSFPNGFLSWQDYNIKCNENKNRRL